MSANSWDKLHDVYAKEDWIDKPNIFAEQVLEFFPKKGMLLDIGCGQGQDSRFFAANGFKVTGIDISEKALFEARQKSKDIVFIEADTSKPLEFDNQSFEVVYAHLSLHYFDTEVTKQIFSEIARVLKPGGIFAFFTNSNSDPEFGQGEKLEDELFFVDSKSKRYLSVESARKFASPHFTELLADNMGETYKDAQKGIHNLIRYVGTKNAEL